MYEVVFGINYLITVDMPLYKKNMIYQSATLTTSYFPLIICVLVLMFAFIFNSAVFQMLFFSV